MISNNGQKSELSNWRAVDINKPKEFEFVKNNDAGFTCVLPASPNWYCSNIISCANGFCAVGGKNAVFVLNLKKNPPVVEWDIYAASSIGTKVTSVSLVCVAEKEDAAPDYVAVGMEDGLSRIFDFQTKKLYKEHHKHKVRVAAMSWSHLNPNSVWSGDDKGTISIWNYLENCVDIWSPLAVQIGAMELCATESVAAIGYSNGNVIVADAAKFKILKIFKSHMDEVTALSWCPGYYQGVPTVASASKDRTFRIWNIVSDKSLASFSVPRKLPGQKSNEATKSKWYHPLLWLDETRILTGYPNGEILCWDTTNGKWYPLGKSVHNRIIFSLCKDLLTNQFVSTSMDRLIGIWNINSLQPICALPSFGGFVYSLSATPHDPYTLAVGVGDNTIRVWTMNNEKMRYNMQHFWQGIKTKVLAISFHPNKEGILGFGTEDGHVGCCSVLSHKVDVSASYHNKSVYSLCWGPFCTTAEDQEGDVSRVKCLFSVGGEGSILMHKMGAFNQDAIDVSKMIKQSNQLKIVPLRSDICWRHDNVFVAVGNEDGSIDILKSIKLKLVCHITAHKKMVNCMAWHHNYASAGSDNFVCMLASGSNEETVCIHDLSAVVNSEDTKETLVAVNPSQQLVGHTGRITRLVWSPHANGMLASSSYDGSVQVWNVSRSEGIANFRGHIGRVHSVLWSFNDPDVLYSGGEDFTLRRWKLSLQEHKTPPVAKKEKSRGKKQKKPTSSENSLPSNTGATNNIKTDVAALPISISLDDATCLLKEGTRIDVPDISVSVIPKDGVKEVDRKKKKLKSLLKTSAVSDSKKKEFKQEDCVKLAKYLKAESDKTGSGKLVAQIYPGKGENIHLGLFGTRADAYEMLNSECEAHMEAGTHDQLLQLEIWRNNIGGALDEAYAAGNLTEIHVSVSVLGGYDVWKATTLAFAEQLEAGRNFHLASVYYLALGDVYKAIDVFRMNGYFRESLTLAKVQLSKSDPVINEIYLSWAKKLTTESSFESAAECYMAAGCVREAIDTLAMRSGSAASLSALKVAEIYDLKECLSEERVTRCLQLLISEQKWDECQQWIWKYDNKLLQTELVVGELLVEHLLETDLVVGALAASSHISHRFYTKEKAGASNEFFLRQVLLLLETQLDLTASSKLLSNSFGDSALKSVTFVNASVNSSSKQVLCNLVGLITAGVIYLLKRDLHRCFKIWLSAFNLLFTTGNQASLCKIFSTLFPRYDVTHSELVKLYAVSNNELMSTFTNFLAYYYVGVLYKKWWQYCSQRLDATVPDALHSVLSVATNLVSDNSELNLVGRDKDHEDQVVSSSEEKDNMNAICSAECEPKTGSDASNFTSNECTRNVGRGYLDCSAKSYDPLSFVSCISSVLLSEAHVEHSKLGQRLQAVETHLTEMTIKRKLQEQQRHKKVTSDDDTPLSVKHFLDDIIEEVVANVDSEKQVIDVDVNPALLRKSELAVLQRILTEKIEAVPSYIKDYCFPDPMEIAKVLICLCCKAGVKNEKLKTLIHHIHDWELSNGGSSSAYLDVLIRKL